MDPSATFYQTLSGASFTLLGIWFGVMQFSHGGWRTDPARHATTVHITLKFFLPGVLGMFSLLASANDGGIVWRVSFVLGGLAGIGESLYYLLRGVGQPATVRRLSLVDPLLYAAIAAVAFVPPGTLVVTPLQAEGMVTGLVFITGLVAVWIALAERGEPGATTATASTAPAAPPAEPRRPAPAPRRAG